MDGNSEEWIFSGIGTLGVSITVTTVVSIIGLYLKFYRKKKTTLSISDVKNLICEHQGEYSQFSFIASQIHKSLKESITNNIDTKNTEERIQGLTGYLARNFLRIAKNNFKTLDRHFEGRHVVKPRICLKTNYEPNNLEEGSKVLSYARSDDRVKYNSECSAIENTGFAYIQKTGKHYIEDNIAKKSKNHDYVNPRLCESKLRMYNEPSTIKKFYWKTIRLITKKPIIDTKWVECWESNDGTDYKDCYKSTLIIPLTLWNQNLEEEFINKYNLENVGRTIFGYLCFDHYTEDYFNETSDIEAGYIIADILSLYLLATMTYTSTSDTYKTAVNSVKCNKE